MAFTLSPLSPPRNSRLLGKSVCIVVRTGLLRAPSPSAYTLAAGSRKQGAWTYLKERMMRGPIALRFAVIVLHLKNPRTTARAAPTP